MSADAIECQSSRAWAKLQAFREAHATLLRAFPHGSTVYTILRKVSRSGMQRHISVLALIPGYDADDTPQVADLHPNWPTSVVTGYRLVPRGLGYDGLVLNGCGADMGYEICASLSYALYGEMYALKHRWL